MKRTYKLIAVPTKTNTNIIRTEDGVMVYQLAPTLVQDEKSIALYAISPEYIGEDDPYYYNGSVYTDIADYSTSADVDEYMKVIASNDIYLNLPKLPETYLEYWVGQYNSGNIIDEIELEVSGGSSTMNMFSVETNSDNEVVIPLVDRIQISREIRQSRYEKEQREYSTVAYDIAPESIPTNTIEQAAEIYVGDLYHSFEFQKKQDNIDAYCAGAFSNEAKEYHTKSLYTIEEVAKFHMTYRNADVPTYMEITLEEAIEDVLEGIKRK